MEPIDNKFENLTEIHKNIVLEFANILNIDDISTCINFLEISDFNLNVFSKIILNRLNFFT